jgi:seryl-tRNA synthetase
LLSKSVKELRNLITIFKKRLNLVKKTIRKTDARLSNKIAYLEKSLNKTEDDIITIEKKISEIITDRDHVINVLARIVDSGLKPGHSA